MVLAIVEPVGAHKSRGQSSGELVGKLEEVSRPSKCLSPSGHVFILSTNPFSETLESEGVQLESGMNRFGAGILAWLHALGCCSTFTVILFLITEDQCELNLKMHL